MEKTIKGALLLVTAALSLSLVLGAEIRSTRVLMGPAPSEMEEPSLQTGHWWEADVPLDHPYWWTLSDALTPGELRERLQQRHLKLQLEAAEEMRRVVEHGTEAPQGKTAWVVDGQETPELFAVWDAYHAFSSVMVARRGKEEQERELVEFGIEPSAAAHIISIGEQVEAKQIELWQETFREGQNLRRLVETATVRRGAAEVRRIRMESDLATLAAVTDTPLDAVREIVRLARRDTVAEATIPLMVLLRTIIGEEQWDRFRRYLLTEVTPFMSKSAIFSKPD